MSSLSELPAGFEGRLAFYLFGMKLGLVTPTEVTAWVDHQIENSDIPEAVLCDLSLSGSDKDKLVTLIQDVVADSHRPLAARLILTRLRLLIISKTIDFRLVSWVLRSVITHFNREGQEAMRLYGSEDAIDLALDGSFGTVDEAFSRTLDDLSPHSAFDLDKPEAWQDQEQILDQLLEKEERAWQQQLRSRGL